MKLYLNSGLDCKFCETNAILLLLVRCVLVTSENDSIAESVFQSCHDYSLTKSEDDLSKDVEKARCGHNEDVPLGSNLILMLVDALCYFNAHFSGFFAAT